LTIEGNLVENAFSQNALIVVDAFDVTTPGIAPPGYGSGYRLRPRWIQGNRDKAYRREHRRSNTVGSQATITFTGTGISWIGARGPQCGIARVFLDGAFVEDFDTYSQTEGPQHTDFSRSGLAAGPIR